MSDPINQDDPNQKMSGAPGSVPPALDYQRPEQNLRLPAMERMAFGLIGAVAGLGALFLFGALILFAFGHSQTAGIAALAGIPAVFIVSYAHTYSSVRRNSRARVVYQSMGITMLVAIGAAILLVGLCFMIVLEKM